MVGVVYPDIKPPEGVNIGRWIEVNLEEQTLAVYDNYQTHSISIGHALCTAPIGIPTLVNPQSRGCVNLTIGDARWIFDWAKEGDWVYVHDLSERTPTDLSLYGRGAP